MSGGSNGSGNGHAPPKPETAGPKRFYKEVATRREEGGYAVTLDGRPVRTPKKLRLDLPNEALAEAVAGEWREQGDTVKPASMPLTRLANTAIDLIAADPTPAVDEIIAYAGNDLLCYRAEGPVSLVARQAAAWDPLLAWARELLGSPFEITEGIVHRPQLAATIAAVRARVERMNPFVLAGLQTATTLTGSAVLALAVLMEAADAANAWTTAHVDEAWQADQWGTDAEAAQRLSARKAEFLAAALFMRLSAH